MKDGAVCFLQISDIHLFADPKEALLGVPTEESLKNVLALVEDEPDLDFIVLSGDLSQDGSEASYRRLAELVSKFSVPVYVIPGNHDNTIIMNEVYPYKQVKADKHLLFPDWQVILLDSHKPHHVEGELSEKELEFMEQCLIKHPQKAVIIFHHQPVDIGCAWLQPLGLKNSQDFWQRLRPFKQASAVLFGHIHQVFETNTNNVQLYSAPAVCFQFKGNQSEFELDYIPQGLRKVILHADGSIETNIKRVEKYVGKFDGDAKGY